MAKTMRGKAYDTIPPSTQIDPIFTESDSVNKKEDGQGSNTVSAVKREILTNNEIKALGKEYVIAFLENFHEPVILKRLNYLTDKYFKGKFDSNKTY